MDKIIQDKYNHWCKNVKNDELYTELEAMRGNDKLIENSFFKDLAFGTGGLRGVIGAGSNCLNIYTVAKITYGLVMYLKKINGNIATISYDSRNKSKLFAETVAKVFASNGIKVYLVSELMPTPVLSFITRHFNANIGVMVTASHNPAEYNGYKVYGGDGCQVTDELAMELADNISTVDEFNVTTGNFNSYVANKQIEYVDDSVIELFLSHVYNEQINKVSNNLSIVYTPLNGSGYKLVPEILRRIGLSDFVVVSQQSMPDGNFPTCSYPNPEKKETLQLGVELAMSISADLLIATDPDCDRVGIAVRHKSEYKLVSGNEVGVLLTNYILSQRKAKGTLPCNPLIVKTIVTSELVNKIANEYNARVANVLTGFKYIGDIIGKLEAQNRSSEYVFGFEESYGYLSGTYVRDKDAVVASMLIAEMASYYKQQNLTLIDVLDSLYNKFGTYQHSTLSYKFPGAEGFAKMKQLMQKVRTEDLPLIGQLSVVKKLDYMSQNEFDLPSADVVQFDLEGGNQIIVRPSGTEPLIKVYLTVCQDSQSNAVLVKNLTSFCDEFLQ